MISDQNQNNFRIVFLGQSILKYKVPLNILESINNLYENKYTDLKAANKQLVGKIEKEHSLFYDGEDTSKMTRHNHLPKEVWAWFIDKFKHYLKWNSITEYRLHLNSVWVNQMFEHEYNPVHVHQGSFFTGLSSVMILKLPESYGVEYSAADSPLNGQLQILGAAAGQFAKIDYSPKIEVGDFFVFPYDVRHCVYPFNGPGWRRTLAANMDVEYNPIKHRGVS
tara:strand:+ start:219 stop:887 length:669 start_codon:yes stop_codon:yes gene_type:complete